MSEPQYYQPEHANGLENGSRPAAWAPARLARRLFEQSGTDGAVPSQRLTSEGAPGKLYLLIVYLPACIRQEARKAKC